MVMILFTIQLYQALKLLFRRQRSSFKQLSMICISTNVKKDTIPKKFKCKLQKYKLMALYSKKMTTKTKKKTLIKSLFSIKAGLSRGKYLKILSKKIEKEFHDLVLLNGLKSRLLREGMGKIIYRSKRLARYIKDLRLQNKIWAIILYQNHRELLEKKLMLKTLIQNRIKWVFNNQK